MAETIKTSKTMVTNLTEGSVPKLLFTFAAPLFVSNALQAIYNIVDMVVVGRIIGGTGMSAVATGGKRALPDNIVFTYQGDGDLASIGMAETVHAAARNENITVIFINKRHYLTSTVPLKLSSAGPSIYTCPSLP